MNKHILLIEGAFDIASNVQHFLHAEGFSTEHAPCGVDGISRARRNNPDVIILDLGLPDLSGEDVARQLRQVSAAPVVVLTAVDDPDRKLTTLNNGADDYLAKPFEPQELIARVKAQPRRAAEPGVVDVASLTLIESNHECVCGRERAQLSPTEFRIMHVLATQPGRVCSREEILRKAWPDGPPADVNAINVHLLKLRRKLDELSWPGRIRTVRGMGYALKLPSLDV